VCGTQLGVCRLVFVSMCGNAAGMQWLCAVAMKCACGTWMCVCRPVHVSVSGCVVLS
jgi:hypothetical protein